MAASLVQSASALATEDTSTITPSLTGVATGNTIVIAVICASDTTTAISAPTNYTVAVAPTKVNFPDIGRNYCIAIFYRENAPSGSHSPAITIAGTSVRSARAAIMEFSGLLTSSSLDVTASGSAGSGVTSGNTGTTGTTAQADALAIAVMGIDPFPNSTGNNISNPPSTYTNVLIVQDDQTNPFIACNVAYKVLSATGTQSASWTWDTASGYVAGIAVFKASAGGGGGNAPRAAHNQRQRRV